MESSLMERLEAFASVQLESKTREPATKELTYSVITESSLSASLTKKNLPWVLSHPRMSCHCSLI